MNTYILKGRVLPIRAALSFDPINILTKCDNDSKQTEIELSIYCNEITIYYDTENEKPIYDIKNECIDVCNTILATIGFVAGHGYNLEINQILNREKEINYVFGIGIPCLEERNRGKDIGKFIGKVMAIGGEESKYLHRCLIDLQLSIAHPIDTPFYCYRAVESLRHLCRVRYNISAEKDQWSKLSEITGNGWGDMKGIKDYAADSRHGDHRNFTSQQRAEFFVAAWDIVESFINNISTAQQGDAPESATLAR